MPPPVLDSDPTILASWFCPFAQRTLIAANFKKPALRYTHHEVTHEELYGKPAWFRALHPQGLVPTIAWRQQQGEGEGQQQPAEGAAGAAAAGGGGGAAAAGSIPRAAAAAEPGVVCIRESLVCNEFLEDAYPSPSLLPPDPVGRAACRLIAQRFSDRFVPAFYRLLVQQAPEAQAAAAAALDAELAWLAAAMDPGGPLALGAALSLADCAVAPFLLRLYVLEHYRSYTSYKALQGGAVGARLDAYLAAITRHPAVAATLRHPDGPGTDYSTALLASYARYADGTANSMMARDAAAQGGGGGGGGGGAPATATAAAAAGR